MLNDKKSRIKEDVEQLSEQLKFFSKEELCTVLEDYIETVKSEKLEIGLEEYNIYIELLTEEINRE